MAEQNFVDYVKICCRSGAGGAGSSHFYRAKGIPKGGPDGGDGGRGGHIILRGNRNVWTLLSLKYRKHIIAGRGVNGGENNRTGADGDDIILDVPLGTVARDAETGDFEFEITEHDETRILLAGGRGGLGNTNFKSATNQAPRYSQPGEPGQEEWKILELKVLADVGLVGFPNAGKSTFLSVITAAKPEIAAYPFTTITPNLGMVQYRDGRSFVIADIPGIIEDAHKGKGLGHRFLRHIERNATLLFMVPSDADSIKNNYQTLLHELEMYNPELLDKPRILAITKSDLIDEELQELLQPEIPKDVPHIFISSVTQYNIQKLKDLLWETINKFREDKPAEREGFLE
ncbi:GTPase ObgE [Flavilitoribacter nigricans]|uniref:GTPase Obg n=1 Tax=Flavilitoribacter nigricans (strain ATCC 23147 / DSM 23189 / NBRC 102662 / NCIMB 1420 / SS-2) TaxID=1122177 RepID=A0A2D0NB12_FLAN2|nr:GTPase ObgE [Flavilitoribacter nigricans]PHN05568.1 GTPase ObgE [Flavilitoribacter nigricans DSM 23189 = NBRC 102662]